MNMPNEGSLEFLDNYGLFFEGGRSPLRFFQDCLMESILYKRAAGYFSSSVFVAVNESLSQFVLKGGTIRLVCSPRLMPEDFEEIRAGASYRLVQEEAIRREIVSLLESKETKSAAKILGLLISSGNLEIRIATKDKSDAGIFHSKVGIFADSYGGKVAFIGSTNETWSGWSEFGNAESFMAKSTYRGPESKQDVADIESYFDDLWENNVIGLEVLELNDSSKKILEESAKNENLAELIEDARRVHKESEKNAKLQQGNKRILMKHQREVIESWKIGNLGIVDHATGSGKTVTALKIIADWIQDGKPALVIVPSSLLQKQWRNEIAQEIGIPTLLVGGDTTNRATWLETLSDNTRKDRDFGARITLAVLASASKKEFLQRLKVTEDLLVVCDEVHTIGQIQSRDLLRTISSAGGRLGLSATYQRFGDPEGTSMIESCFGRPLSPSFTISDAIREGRLVPYEYHFGKVTLDAEELEEYEKLDEEIKRNFARNGDVSEFGKLPDFLKMLVFKRAKILKKASKKSEFARMVLQQNYKDDDRWLVYCDDSEQMSKIEFELRDSHIPILKYFDAMEGDKAETLRVFSQQGGVLLAIKCLDEGIDIPSATHALILASSQNPREYIQRRGRVLRVDKATGKNQAVIWDVVVVDEDGVPVNDTEIERMLEFAQDATNSMVHVELLDLIHLISTKQGKIMAIMTEDDLAPLE